MLKVAGAPIKVRTPMEPEDYADWKVEQLRLDLAGPTPALPLEEAAAEEAAAELPGIVTVVAVDGFVADAVTVTAVVEQ